MKLRANPLCEECKILGRIVEASMVHHIISIKGKDDPCRLEWDNLQSLCEACHDAKHSSAPEARRVQGCDVNGMPIHPDHPWVKGRKPA